MRIGTAVPTEEQLARVRHYFIQDRSVAVNYTAGMYEAEALELIGRLFAEGHETLVVTGGSMLYIDALCYGLDDFPEVPMMLREHLMECLRDEGVEVLADQLKELDPVTYDEIDLSNGQRVIRALEVCLYTGQPFSSFKTRRSTCPTASASSAPWRCACTPGSPSPPSRPGASRSGNSRSRKSA